MLYETSYVLTFIFWRYSRFSKFPKIDRYLNTQRLVRLRERVLVDMDFERPTVSHHENVFVEYDKPKYLEICKTRWNLWENKPIENASEFCYLLRKLVNTDPSRQQEVLDLNSLNAIAGLLASFGCDSQAGCVLYIQHKIAKSMEADERKCRNEKHV